jgi:hypothetical protein
MKSIIYLCSALLASKVCAYSPGGKTSPTTRSDFMKTILTTVAASTILPAASIASDKQLNLPPSEIASIVENDLVQNGFLTNGKLTRSIYDENAIFTDEIDTYKLDQWIKGTSRLFVGPPGSRVDLVGSVDANEKEVVFRFDEDLMFNIPFKPVVKLTGKVVLARDESTGLITSYREYWDQDVKTVLKSAKF